MKKVFISVALISMSVALSTSFVSCKDYDDDITEINGNTSDLSSQISALKEQLQQQATSLNTAAQNAQKAADQAAAAAKTAQEKGDAAMAQAQSAQAAAEQAKADALAAIAEQAQTQATKYAALESKINAATADLPALKTQLEGFIEDAAALQGKVSAIDAKLANVDLNKMTSDIADILTKVGANTTEVADLKSKYAELNTSIQTLNQFKQAAQTQLAALENFKTTTTTDITAIKGQISEIETKLATVLESLTDLADLKTDLADVKTQLTGINTEITKINGALSTLSEILNRRLSSVTFVPSAYVNGIPAIDFSSIEYVPMEKAAAGNWAAGTGDAVNVASTDITAVYRLNPSTVGLEDIDVNGIEFVDGVATSRAATPALIEVAENGASINENGELVLNVVKTSDNLFNKGLASNQINIVALKVPVAKKHLFSDETEANVFSEYVRLAEFQLTPQIGQVGEEVATPQFNDSIAAYTTDVEVVKVPYTKSQDLLEIADAVLLDKTEWFASLDTPDARAAYGLDLTFHIAKAEYKVDGVDQQIFGKIEGSTFSPVIPTGYSIQSIPGMTPIVAVTLVDVKNHNVVDQRYIKLELSAEKSEYEIDYPNFTEDLFCGDKTFNISWADFQKNVLSKCGTAELGYLTQDEFIKYYVNDDMTITYGNYAEDADEEGVTATFDATADNAITWVVSAEQVGEVKDVKTVTATITLTNETRGKITITLSLIVTNNTAKLPKLGATDNLIWDNGTMLIYPTNPADPDAEAKATYNTNILTGRTNPYVTGLLDCAGYYMLLDTDEDSPVSLEYSAEYATEYSITAANQGDLEYVRFIIENNEAGIAMVEGEETVNMNWQAYLNGEAAGNLYTIGTSKLHILKPLYLNTVNSEDALVDNSELVTVSLGNYYTINDAYKNVIFKDGAVANQKLYDYYGIETVTFGPDADITIADNIAGTENVRTPADIKLAISVSNDGELSFQNTGAPLQDNAYIIVPVTIKHLWGTLKGNIAVPLQKTL